MTEKESAHPSSRQLDQLTSTNANGDLVTPMTPIATDSPSTLTDLVASGNSEVEGCEKTTSVASCSKQDEVGVIFD